MVTRPKVQEANVTKRGKSTQTSLHPSMLYTLPLTKYPILTLPLSTRLLSQTQNNSPFLSWMTKGKSLRGHHLVITRRVNIILIIKRGLQRRRGRRSKTSHVSLSMSNVSCFSVHLTHLINESVQTTTKVSMHPLKLLYDGLEGHTTSRGGRRKGRGWSYRSCRIDHLYSWPLQLKLTLTLPDRTNANGTHDGEKRRERNRNGEVLKDPCDSRRKDELITGSSVPIDIYNKCYKVRGKINGKTLHQRQKKMSTRLDDGVIVWQRSKIKSHHHVKKATTFSKA